MELAEIFKALDDETRLRIFNLLTRESLCVCEIETILEINQSNASRHLNKLKSTGVITYDKKSQWVYYKIDSNFKDNNSLLCDFLNKKMKDDSKMLQDIENLKKYKNKDISCERLRKILGKE